MSRAATALSRTRRFTLRSRDSRCSAHRVDVADDLVVLADLDEPRDRVQLVGELVGLRPQQLGRAAERPDLALEVGQLGAVAQGGDRAEPPAVLGDRHAVHDEDPSAADHDVVCGGRSPRSPAWSPSALPPRARREPRPRSRRSDRLIPTECSGRSRRRAGDVVDQGDAVLRVEGDDALGDAVEHGLAVLGQAGDLARLEPEGLALDPPGEQPGAAEAEHRGRCRGRSAGRTRRRAGAPTRTGSRTAIITVPRCSPTAVGLDARAPAPGRRAAARPSTPWSPTSSRPPRPPGAPSGIRPPSSEGSEETRTSSSASAMVTMSTRDWVTTDLLGEGGQAGALLGHGQVAPRTRGFAASCSARAETRRPSTRVKVASDCARDTAPTVTRTTIRMRQLEGRAAARRGSSAAARA